MSETQSPTQANSPSNSLSVQSSLSSLYDSLLSDSSFTSSHFPAVEPQEQLQYWVTHPNTISYQNVQGEIVTSGQSQIFMCDDNNNFFPVTPCYQSPINEMPVYLALGVNTDQQPQLSSPEMLTPKVDDYTITQEYDNNSTAKQICATSQTLSTTATQSFPADSILFDTDENVNKHLKKDSLSIEIDSCTSESVVLNTIHTEIEPTTSESVVLESSDHTDELSDENPQANILRANIPQANTYAIPIPGSDNYGGMYGYQMNTHAYYQNGSQFFPSYMSPEMIQNPYYYAQGSQQPFFMSAPMPMFPGSANGNYLAYPMNYNMAAIKEVAKTREPRKTRNTTMNKEYLKRFMKENDIKLDQRILLEIRESIHPNKFPKKIWLLANDPRFPFITWNTLGNGILIHECGMVPETLKLFFRSDKYNSFLRQLHLYGFYKVNRARCIPQPDSNGHMDQLRNDLIAEYNRDNYFDREDISKVDNISREYARRANIVNVPRREPIVREKVPRQRRETDFIF